MNRSYTDHKGKRRIGEIEIFLEIAIDCYRTVMKLWSETTELMEYKTQFIDPTESKLLELAGIDHLERLFVIQQERFKSEINGILSLATFYEALINEIGITELGSTYYNDNLDKLSILSKWEVVLKLVYGTSISTDHGYYQAMKNVISTRNKLAHYKSKESNGSNTFEEFDKILEMGILNMGELIQELKSMDTEKEIIRFFDIEIQIARTIT